MIGAAVGKEIVNGMYCDNHASDRNYKYRLEEIPLCSLFSSPLEIEIKLNLCQRVLVQAREEAEQVRRQPGQVRPFLRI